MDSGTEKSLRDMLRLMTTPRVGSVKLSRLLDKLGSQTAVLAAGYERLADTNVLKADQTDWITGRRWDEASIDGQLEAMELTGTRGLFISDDDYPEWLSQIYDPPPLLFVRGDSSCLADPCVGIVGTREPTSSGRETARRTAAELAAAGICIVSGMALGIDSEAHEGALEAGGTTAAVMGSGVDVIYPPQNEELAERIIAAGCIISEYRMGTPPEARNFPRRNRLISGLSRGLLVVEAPRKSGALLTAGYALDQNRDVFAVPGDPNWPSRVGTNTLIADGARLVQSPADILAELDLGAGYRPFPPAGESGEQLPQKVLPPLSREERTVYEGLGHDVCHVDELADRLGMDVSQVLGVLLRLDMKSLIREHPGKLFSLS
ncbi:MAG: DNA-protecting protein DprA [Candidatus Glassbacteria bacterium]|nr:DNA-protecting protein DprA [Candidatus Glassbacteria bacterium]